MNCASPGLRDLVARVPLVEHAIDVFAEFGDLCHLGVAELPARRGPVDRDHVDDLVGPFLFDVVGRLAVDPRVVSDHAIFAGTLGTPATAQIARLQVDCPEVKLAEGKVDDALDVFERLRVGVAHGVGVGRAVRVSPPHRRVGLNDLVVTPTVRSQAEDQADIPLLRRVLEPVQAAAARIVHGAGDVRRPAIGREETPRVEVIEAGRSLDIHRPDRTLDGLVVKLRSRPILQGKRPATHVVDPCTEGDSITIRGLDRPSARLDRNVGRRRGVRDDQRCGAGTGSRQ